MVSRHVERFEIVIVVLGFGPPQDLESQPGKDGLDLFSERRERVTVSEPNRSAGEGDVDAADRTATGLERLALGRQRLVDVVLEGVRRLTECATLFRRDAGHALEKGRHGATLSPQVAVAEILQATVVRYAVQLGEKSGAKAFNVG